jgi:hypothetical protein
MKNDEKRFTGTVAAVDEAILAATPAEVAAELRALNLDPKIAAAGMRAKIETAVRAQGKKLMQAAAEEMRRDRGLRIILGGAPTGDDLRAKLERLLSRPSVPTTLAAREGRNMSDADIVSFIEDLAELGITEDEQP